MTDIAPAPVIDTSTTPAASDLLAPPPAMTPEIAATKRVEFLADAALRDGVIRGDPETVKRWKEINAALVPKVDGPAAEQREYADRQAALAPLKMTAGPMDELFWDGVATRSHVSLEQKEIARQTWAAVMRDPQWRARCISGGIEENALKMRINGILAAPVGTPEQVEADLRASMKRVGITADQLQRRAVGIR